MADEKSDIKHAKHGLIDDAVEGNGENIGFWSPGFKKQRRELFVPLLTFFAAVTLLVYIALSIFWGSTWLLVVKFPAINIWVVDFDSAISGSAALAGPPLVQELQQVTAQSMPHLTYQFMDPSLFPGGNEQVMQAIGHSEAWGAVVINGNATSAWRSAIETGDAAYDPTGAVGLYFSGARFYQIVLLYIVPYMVKNVNSGLSLASQLATQNFISTAVTAQNATAFITASASPSALGTAFGYYRYDVRPMTAWAAAAYMEAGLIYGQIFLYQAIFFAFILRMQTGLETKLRLRSLIGLRLGVPFVLYFWLSLCYVIVMRAFQIPMGNSIGRAGFVVLWAITYVGFLGLGLALEAALSLLTPRWFPLALVMWIILNPLTSSFLPIQLMQRFYTWFVMFPFYNLVQAYKLIYYDTEPPSRLGTYFGVLAGWAVGGCITVSLCQIVERRRMDKMAAKAAARQQEKKNETGGEDAESHGDEDEHRAGRSSTSDERSPERDASRSTGASDETETTRPAILHRQTTGGLSGASTYRTPAEEPTQSPFKP